LIDRDILKIKKERTYDALTLKKQHRFSLSNS